MTASADAEGGSERRALRVSSAASSFLTGGAAAAGITLINLLGSSGGLVAPPWIGWIRVRTGSFAAPVYALAGLLLAGALLLIVVRRSVGSSTLGPVASIGLGEHEHVET